MSSSITNRLISIAMVFPRLYVSARQCTWFQGTQDCIRVEAEYSLCYMYRNCPLGDCNGAPLEESQAPGCMALLQTVAH